MNISPALFHDAFVAAFKINRHFLKWNTAKQRTSHMVSHIYRTIADYLDLSVEYEYQGIDAVFYRRAADAPQDTNIQIAVEHEHDARQAHQEVQKLLSHTFPLNVLITYTWDGNQDGRLVAPHFHHEWLSLRFGSLLSAKPPVGDFLIILPKGPPIADERQWSYYVYRDRSFQPLTPEILSQAAVPGSVSACSDP
jgi:hypothetical protein